MKHKKIKISQNTLFIYKTQKTTDVNLAKTTDPTAYTTITLTTNSGIFQK